VLLFRPEHVAPILEGRKTETRRLWKSPRVRVGQTYQAKTTLFGKPFALLRVEGLWRERLGDISSGSICAEGYNTLEEFQKEWIRINRVWNPDELVWVVRFTEVKE